MTPYDRLGQSLGGVTVVTITPFPDYELNLDGLRSNLEWLTISGVDAVASCGGTGEYLSLTAAEVPAVGFTSGIAKFAPALSIGLRDALKNNDGARIPRYRKQAEPLEQLRAENGGAYNIACIKEAMALCGLAAGPVRPPGADLPDELRPLGRRFVQSCQQHLAAQATDLPVTPSLGRSQQP